MKKLFNLLLIFTSFVMYAQVNRYASFAVSNSERSDFLVDMEEDNPDNRDFNTFIHLYISSHLNDAEIKGQGKSETVLVLKFADNGTLRMAATTGRNTSLNNAVLNIFKHRAGKRFRNMPALHAHQFRIPITLLH